MKKTRWCCHHLTCEKCDDVFHSEESLQGHGVNVHAVAHPQTCDNCDKEFFSVDSLQGHAADVHKNGEPM